MGNQADGDHVCLDAFLRSSRSLKRSSSCCLPSSSSSLRTFKPATASLVNTPAATSISCLAASKRMRAMCHRPPVLCTPAGDGRMMNEPTRLGQCLGDAPRVHRRGIRVQSSGSTGRPKLLKSGAPGGGMNVGAQRVLVICPHSRASILMARGSEGPRSNPKKSQFGQITRNVL